MLKKLLYGLLGALAVAAIGPAMAVIGNPPQTGFALVDGDWLNGLAAGHNRVFLSGITAAGTTQATATQLAPRIAMYQVDTVGASSGVALPPCTAGATTSLYNASGTTLTIYPSITNNPLTAAQDTINSATSFSLATHVLFVGYCAKNGVWGAK